jgi:hypothetical protein
MDLVEWSRHLEEVLRRPPLIRVNGKRPLDEEWPTGPYEEPDLWRNRLRDHHGNVGLVLGRGMLAVDVDGYKVGAGALDALADAVELDTHTVTQITGRGGQHYLYSYDPSLHVPSVPLTPRGFPAIEIKADGGQIIVEPSTHPDNGRRYVFEDGMGPGEIEIHPAPEKLLKLIGASEATLSRRSKRWHRLDPAELGDLDDLNVQCIRILLDHFEGHDPVRLHDETIGVWRPGKADGSLSFTFGFVGPGVGKCWTDGWPPFEQNKVYDLGQLRRLAGITPTIEIPDLELPEGFRLWREGDGDLPWPTLAEAARQGPVGRYLELIEAEIEVTPAPVGMMALVELGTLIGRRAAIRIGEHRHHANLFALVVGETSIGGKGSADTATDRLVHEVDSLFPLRHVVGGFGSGEAVIHAVRDTEPGEDPVEKRRVIMEAEFGGVLRVARREQNILSQVIRQGFDYKPLQHRTKTHGVITASGHHLSVIGAVSPKELVDSSTELDLVNGWLNRFMFCHSEIRTTLPFGGNIDATSLKEIATEIGSALDALDAHVAGRTYELKADTEVGGRWGPWYSSVRFGTGSVPSVTRRQHVHVARLALILAVLDGADEIGIEHLEAAIAWSDFSVAIAERIFGQGMAGRPHQLLIAIRETGIHGLDGTAQRNLFNRNLTGGELDRIRRHLEGANLIHTFKRATGGRPAIVSVAIWPLRPNDINDKRSGLP